MSTTQDLNSESHEGADSVALPTRKEPLSDDQLSSIAETLQAEREELLEPLEQLEAEEPADQDLTDDPGIRLAEVEMNRALTAMQEAHLKDIDDALERLENGSYGVCLDCGVDIPAV